MTTKSQYVIGLIKSIESQASNRSAANTLAEALEPIKERMKSKSRLGIDPTAEKAPAVIAAVRAAIAAYEAQQVIKTPNDAEILAGLDAADADTPTEL